jgi:hypothetical protein
MERIGLLLVVSSKGVVDMECLLDERREEALMRSSKVSKDSLLDMISQKTFLFVFQKYS